jgi:hypothetical protein
MFTAKKTKKTANRLFVFIISPFLRIEDRFLFARALPLAEKTGGPSS